MKPVKKMYMRNSLKPIESVDNIDTAISTTAIAEQTVIPLLFVHQDSEKPKNLLVNKAPK